MQKAVALLSPHERERAEALMDALGRLAKMYGGRRLSTEALATSERAAAIGERAPGISADARVSIATSLWPVLRTTASPEAADKLLVRHAARFRRCYNDVLAIDPNVQGTVRITARIGPSGEVSSAFTYVPVGSMARVGECVVDSVFLQSTFAPPEGGGATIVIPVTFVAQ